VICLTHCAKALALGSAVASRVLEDLSRVESCLSKVSTSPLIHHPPLRNLCFPKILVNFRIGGSAARSKERGQNGTNIKEPVKRWGTSKLPLDSKIARQSAIVTVPGTFYLTSQQRAYIVCGLCCFYRHTYLLDNEPSHSRSPCSCGLVLARGSVLNF
jgi:hypothetical protein